MKGRERINRNGQQRKDEGGRMKDEGKTKAFLSSFRLHPSSFLYPVHPC
jgi:hypothetical protein